ncbi:MAG: PSD1 and planctomycete cytochrome C domain-containing protein [Planctomycetaceae bacterium]
MKLTQWIGICIILAGSCHAVNGADGEAVKYETQIQPIFNAKCGKCHGETKQTAGLNLATADALGRGGESGAVLVPGKPDESPLFELVHDGQMPPKGNEGLTKNEIELIRRWIVEGARLPGAATANAITQHQVIPLMFLRCTACHGGRRREAGLDLRTKEGILKGGKSGPAVVSGKPEESLLIKRIRAEEMPPRRLLVSVSVKPMESGELKKLEAWIAAGMPESPIAPDVASLEPDKLVTDADRDFWSFQPLHRVTPPSVINSPADKARVHNSIDQFILAKLREKNLSFSNEADRVTLIRRVSFDLIGLPPTPEEVAEFLNDPSPLAYESLVERLLASPHYGERWGRHWLDVAGYADSEGAQNEDRVRPNMWRYRDYVVRAFNSDKPYDRFLHEQLAGDELDDYEHAPQITEDIYDNLVATGFLRTAPDRTFANITNFVPDRLEVIADEMQILGSAVLGLTLHCARCHTHKFDPIPQRDYYRLAASLKDALDEHDWLGPEVRQLNFVTTKERQAWESHEREITNQVTPLKMQVEAEKDEAAKKTLQERIKKLEAGRRPEPKIRALWSRGDPSPTYLLQRGNYLTAGAEVGPGVLSVLTDGKTPHIVNRPREEAKTTGRRLALARWLTAPDHPLTARVIVNRVWKHHFGTGLVTTLANFGKTGAPPTHPELLDWLSSELIHRGWSIKDLHRLMVCSTTYRQSSLQASPAVDVDPENRLLSRMPLRRLEGEIVRDSLLAVSGKLDDTPFGPPVDVDVRGDGLVTVKRPDGGGRRSIYVLHRRTKLPTILESFDSPQMGPNCVERGESIVAPQALHLLNNANVHALATQFAERVRREVGDDIDAQVERIHRLAFGISPSQAIREQAKEDLVRLTQQWLTTVGNGPEAPKLAADRALQNYCHAIVNTAEFVYVD